MEYYNGTSWTSVSVTESTDDVLNFEANGKLTWDTLGSWTTVAVDSGSKLYYVRIKANAVYSTEAEINTIAMDQDFVIETSIPIYDLDVNEWGRVTFLSNRIPNGTRNVKIDYTQGYSSVPALIKELTSVTAGIMTYANITGGSYDDATMFTLGRKTISVGEVYVNVAEVVRQFRVRKQEILDSVGRKMNVV